mmetsp:Transcript_3009/g.9192  ORF Transcript_3009/g.9192 Transcript_3009/m.9192 type:complete len:201 (-) Transcript_3009:133-735(-)
MHCRVVPAAARRRIPLAVPWLGCASSPSPPASTSPSLRPRQAPLFLSAAQVAAGLGMAAHQPSRVTKCCRDRSRGYVAISSLGLQLAAATRLRSPLLAPSLRGATTDSVSLASSAGVAASATSRGRGLCAPSTARGSAAWQQASTTRVLSPTRRSCTRGVAATRASLATGLTLCAALRHAVFRHCAASLSLAHRPGTGTH